MLIILVVYTRMGLTIRNSTTNTLNSVVQGVIHGDSRQVQSRKSVIRMLRAVVVLFFICWAPFHAQRLVYVYAQDSDYYPDLNEWLYILSGCLYYFSTTVNPILYNLMSVKYRNAFKQTICCGAIVSGRRKRTIRESQTCNNNSTGKSENTDLRRSVRYSINEAKEIFRTKNGETLAKNGNMNDNVSRKTYMLRKEDSTEKPLLNRTQEQTDENDPARKLALQKTISTTTSSSVT